jgi:hypothetical protein
MARSRRNNPQQSREKKRDALGYEMWMLHETQRQITAWDKAKHKQLVPRDLHLNFAVLESFLVHARNLLRFFYPVATPNPNDLIPDDFFADRGHSWRTTHLSVPGQVRRWLSDINTTLQHLSRRRPRRRIVWNEETIAVTINQLFEEFNTLGPIGGRIVVRHPDSAQRKPL